MNNTKVSLVQTGKAEYPKESPFEPGEHFPEYPFGSQFISPLPNYVYRAVREAFLRLGLDAHSYGTPKWNPLGEMVKPGSRVVIKPNFVMHENRSGNSVESVLTHGSVVRAVLDYVILALKGKGEIAVVDAPQYEADFDLIVQLTGVRQAIHALRQRTSIPLALVDLRIERAIEEEGLVVSRERLAGDPKGYVGVDLGKKSFLSELDPFSRRFRGSDYDGSETVQHHSQAKHEYLISGTVLCADVVINIPKMKTHRKTGVTLCFKNLIGINGDKNWIPHYRRGGPISGCDEHSSYSKLRDLECIIKDRFKSFIYQTNPIVLPLARKIRKAQNAVVEGSHFFQIRGGSWFGNDTLWRSILDLNRILLYGNADGSLQNDQQREYLCVVDGVIGGEGNGPYHTHPVESGCILAGRNPLHIDLIAVQFMGFDHRKIPKVLRALEDPTLFDKAGFAAEVVTNNKQWENLLSRGKPCHPFLPPSSWKEHIELANDSDPTCIENE